MHAEILVTLSLKFAVQNITSHMCSYNCIAAGELKLSKSSRVLILHPFVIFCQNQSIQSLIISKWFSCTVACLVVRIIL